MLKKLKPTVASIAMAFTFSWSPMIHSMEINDTMRRGLPNEMWTQICRPLNNNDLLNIRGLNTHFLIISDHLFQERAIIETPLACLTDGKRKHPAPHTLSYFIRKNFWETRNALKTFKPYPTLGTNLLKCSQFCQEWGYQGAELIQFIGKIAINPMAEEHSTPEHMTFIPRYTGCLTSTLGADPLELRLFLISMEPKVLALNMSIFNSIIENLIRINKKELALSYLRCIGYSAVEKDEAETAQRVYEKAVELGDLDALKHSKKNLSMAYYNQAVKTHEQEDYEQAIIYLKKAHEFGHPQALFNLGLLYEEDLEDNQKAKKYYERSSTLHNSALSQYYLGSILLEEGDIEGAKRYYKLSADNGDEDAQFEIALLLSKENNMEQAVHYYQLSADQGHLDAQRHLGIHFIQKNNINEAIRYYRMAAKQGDADAQWNLACIFYRQNNIEKAKKYWRLAAEQGNVEAQFNLGLTLKDEGKIQEAKHFLDKAAQQGHMNAQCNLGLIFYNEGKKQYAIRFFRLAAAQGCPYAAENLQVLGLE